MGDGYLRHERQGLRRLVLESTGTNVSTRRAYLVVTHCASSPLVVSKYIFRIFGVGAVFGVGVFGV